MSDHQASQQGPESEDELDRQIQEKWAEFAPAADALIERIANPSEFAVGIKSSLAGDDRRVGKYLSSGALKLCIIAAADHFHAVKTLTHEARRNYMHSSHTLSRPIIEHAATGIWLLHPRKREERVLRTFRWYAKSVHDRRSSRFSGSDEESSRAALEDIADQARRASVSAREATQGFKISRAIEYVDEHYPDLGGIGNSYQLSSALSHARPWAVLGTARIVPMSEVAGTEEIYRLEARNGVAFLPLSAGLAALTELLRLYRDRACSPGW